MGHRMRPVTTRPAGFRFGAVEVADGVASRFDDDRSEFQFAREEWTMSQG